MDHALDVLHRVADAVAERLAAVTDWGPSGLCEGQYAFDVATDEIAVSVLVDAGFGVLSEESGLTAPERDRIVVIDPVDGSTNASRAIPWYATAMCVVDEDGPAAALVVNQASGERMHATRGGGAWNGATRLAASGATSLDEAVIGISGLPPGEWSGWFRCFGAAALDLGLVAAGALDGYVDNAALGVWDYLASALICTEAGAVVADADGRELVTLEHGARRSPVAAATPALLEILVDQRRAGTPTGSDPDVR